MPQWRKELRGLIDRNPADGEEFRTLMAALHGAESDRGCAVMAASFVEDCLQVLLTIHAVDWNKSTLSEIFRFEGPLGPFSARIKVAYALGIIDSEIRDDCDRIREIRNAFAHSKVPIDFKTSAIVRGCAGFHAPFPEGMREYLETVNPSRRKYVQAVVSIMRVAYLVMKSARRGRMRKTLQTATYADTAASQDKSWSRLQKRKQRNRLSGKKKALPAPPRSSQA